MQYKTGSWSRPIQAGLAEHGAAPALWRRTSRAREAALNQAWRGGFVILRTVADCAAVPCPGPVARLAGAVPQTLRCEAPVSVSPAPGYRLRQPAPQGGGRRHWACSTTGRAVTSGDIHPVTSNPGFIDCGQGCRAVRCNRLPSPGPGGAVHPPASITRNTT
jgi:hypothetical protein